MLVSFLLTAGLAVLVPPFAEPDGYAHWYRVLAISEGRLAGTVDEDGASGVLVRRSARELQRLAMNGVTFHPDSTVTHRLGSMWAIQIGGGVRIDRDSVGTLTYLPILYGPGALIASVVGLVGDNEMASLVVYRLGVVIAYFSVMVGLFRSDPLPVFVFTAIPMVHFLLLTGHPDVLVLLALLAGGANLPVRSAGGIFAALVAASKVATAILPAFHFFQKDVARRALTNTVLYVVAVSMLYGAWTLYIGPIVDGRGPAAGTNGVEQLRLLLTNPASVYTIAINTLSEFGWFYLEGFLGYLGWFDTRLSQTHLWAVGALLGGMTLVYRANANLVGWIAVSLIYIGGVFLSLYLAWNPPGQPIIGGVQGRYFLPCLAILVPYLVARPLPPLFRLRWTLLAGGMVFQILTAFALVDRYFIP